MTCNFVYRSILVLGCLAMLMGVTSCDKSNASDQSSDQSVATATATPDPAMSDTSADPVDAGQSPKTVGAAEPAARQRTTLRAGGVLDLTFDDLEFDIEPDEDFKRSMLTEEIEQLHGKQIILRGFILGAAVFQQQGIEQFVLVRDNQECCFGPGAKIYHNVQVDMVEGKTTKFSFRPVQVEGTLKIQPWVNPGDGKTYSVFHMTAKRVKH